MVKDDNEQKSKSFEKNLERGCQIVLVEGDFGVLRECDSGINLLGTVGLFSGQETD